MEVRRGGEIDQQNVIIHKAYSVAKALFTRRPIFPCARDISGHRDTDSSSFQANVAE